jgi:hypothetical protein
LLVFSVFPLIQDVAKRSQEKSKKLKAVESGLRELQAKDQHISEEHRKNIYLQRELDKLKQERTRETWLLKNDLRNLRSPTLSSKNSLRSRKRRTKASPLLARVLSLCSLSCVPKTIFTAELGKLLAYKEELLTNMKNMLYHRTGDVERLQKVITDTEQQFVDCLQQIKTLGEEKE